MLICTTSPQTTDIWENTAAFETFLSTNSSCSCSSWSPSYTGAHVAVGHQTRYWRQLVLSSFKGCVSGTKKLIWKSMATNKKRGKRRAGVLQGHIYRALPHGLHVLFTCCCAWSLRHTPAGSEGTTTQGVYVPVRTSASLPATPRPAGPVAPAPAMRPGATRAPRGESPRWHLAQALLQPLHRWGWSASLRERTAWNRNTNEGANLIFSAGS